MSIYISRAGLAAPWCWVGLCFVSRIPCTCSRTWAGRDASLIKILGYGGRRHAVYSKRTCVNILVTGSLPFTHFSGVSPAESLFVINQLYSRFCTASKSLWSSYWHSTAMDTRLLMSPASWKLTKQIVLVNDSWYFVCADAASSRFKWLSRNDEDGLSWVIHSQPYRCYFVSLSCSPQFRPSTNF